MSNKKYFMVLDVETIAAKACNGRKVFNIGVIIADKQGNVSRKTNFLIAEQFTLGGIAELCQDRYCGGEKATKFIQEWENPTENTVKCRFDTVRELINILVNGYNLTVAAYNAAFDFDALEKTSQYYCNSHFWNKEPQTLDIWHVALDTICSKLAFLSFCQKFNLLKEKTGNPATNAETVFAFLSENPAFTEVHSGLADCEIEYAILCACWRAHKKINPTNVGTAVSCKSWQNVRDKYRTWYTN